MEKKQYKEVISMREVQRNYKKIFDMAEKSREPVVLGVRGEPKVVVMGMQIYKKMQSQAEYRKRARDWERTKKELDYFARQGKQGVNLAQFVHEDRQRH
jgi:prevent-host-death family protein